MSIIYVLIPIAILLTVLGIYLFFWAVKTEQFSDLEKEGLSILFEDEQASEESLEENSKSEQEVEHQKSQTSSEQQPEKDKH